MAGSGTFPNNFVTGVRLAEKVDVDERSFTWTIENFAAIEKDLIPSQAINCRAGDKIGLSSVWRIYLEDRPATNSFGIFVQLTERPGAAIECVYGRFSWAVKDKDGGNYAFGNGSLNDYSDGSGFGWSKMLLYEQRKTVPLVDGNLVIHINFKLYGPKPRIADMKPVQALLEEFHSKSTEQTRRDLEGSLEDLADRTIKMMKSSDGKMFPVLSRVLAARSPVFEAMLRTEMIEAEQDTIEVSDISSRPLELMLLFMCTGELQQDWNQSEVIVELTYAAAKYQLLDLLEFLDSMLGRVCDLENAGVLLLLANQLSLKKAEEELLDFVKREAVNSSENVLQILKRVSSLDSMDVEEDDEEGQRNNEPIPACLRKIRRGLSTIQRRKRK